MPRLHAIKRRLLVGAALALVAGIAMSVGLGRALYVEQSKSIDRQFRADIDQLSARFEREVLLNLEVLYALKVAVGVLPEMTSARFTSLTRPILDRWSAIQAFAWAPLIDQARLAEFNHRQAKEFQDFSVTEVRADDFVPVKDRDWYVPVQFIEPLLKNRAALGFDLASEPSRLTALLKAKESGEMVATAGIRLVQEPGNQKGFLVFAPLYKKTPGSSPGAESNDHYGFINGVFRVGELVEQAVGDALTKDFLFQIHDRTENQELLLYSSGDPDDSRWEPGRRYSSPLIAIAGRQWVVEAVPSRAFIQSRRGVLPLFVGAAGSVLVCLVVGYFTLGAKKNAELSAAKAELERISLTDSLTGLANRRHFDAALTREYRRAVREGSTLSLIMIDIDYFKEFNDDYGHPAGDACLVKVAETLAAVFRRPGDLVARYGGEEFAVVLPDTPDASDIAETCRQAIWARAVTHRLSKVADVITISLGVAALAPDRPATPDELVDRADIALYEAKESGRNRVCFAPLSNEAGRNPR